MEDPEVGNSTKGGDCVKYDGGDYIALLPTRNELCDNAEENAYIDEKIENAKPLVFMPHDISDGAYYVGPYSKDAVSMYAINISGTLGNGMKILVQVSGIRPYVDVWVPAGEDPETFRTKLAAKYSMEYGANYSDTELMTGKTCKYYSDEKYYCRMFFINLTKRSEIVKSLIAQGYETASDDTSFRVYFRTIARIKNLKLCEWMGIRRYTKQYRSKSLFAHSFMVDIAFIENISQDKIDEMIKHNAVNRMYYNEKSIIMTWDIETHSDRGSGYVPSAEFVEDDVFMICCTFHWKDSAEPMLQVCLVDVATAPDTRWLTVECGNAENIIRAFRLILINIFPDYMAGFNDFSYDWPFILGKIDQYKLTPIFDDRKVWNYSKILDSKIKCSADDIITASYLHIFGIIPIDVRICFKKLYPKGDSNNSSSLKYYLAQSGLASKADLAINTMRGYYRASKFNPCDEASEYMRHVSYYCVVDALRCQQLLLKRNVINETRDICNLANEYIFNGFMRAGGSRVSNLLGREFNLKNYLTSTIVKPASKEKYQGAYVFPPERGISPNPHVITKIEDGTIDADQIEQAMSGGRPIVGLDFASLYPSIICTYNLSPEMMIDDEAEAIRLMNAGVALNEIAFEYSGTMIRSWSVKHNNDESKIGVYPSVLTYLKKYRGEIKKILAAQEAIKEAFELAADIAKSEGCTLNEALHIGIQRQPTIEKSAKYLMSDTEEEIREKYSKARFAHVTANAKQSAVKVYMNTFYGEAGNSLSPFFKLALAGGVTSFGRKTIKMVADYVSERGFRIKYGDTDSLYLEAPGHVFKEADGRFLTNYNREAWYSEQVKITMVELKKLRLEVNEFLYRDNGSRYLEMNFEEVMYPVVFCGKKKYYGVAHVDVVNFRPEKLFIRGIDIIKQGQSNIAKIVGNRIMNESMQIDNKKTMLEIVCETIADVMQNQSQWTLSDFVLSKAYKPHKQAISVNRFVDRMKAIVKNMSDEDPERSKYPIPEPGDRFNFIVTKRHTDFSLKGNLIHFAVSDKMEFVEVAKTREIDMEYYVRNLIVGISARFVSGDPMFNRPDDGETQKMAIAYLVQFIKSLSNTDKELDRNVGLMYKNAFRQANKKFLAIAEDTYGIHTARLFKTRIINYLIEMDNVYEITPTSLKTELKDLALGYVEDFADEQYLSSVFNFARSETAKMYDKHLTVGKQFQIAVLQEIECDIDQNFDDIAKLIFAYKQNLNEIVEKFRAHAVNAVDSDIEYEFRNMPSNVNDAVFSINTLWDRLLIYAKLVKINEAVTAKFRTAMAYKSYGGVYSQKEIADIVENASELLTLSSKSEEYNWL